MEEEFSKQKKQEEELMRLIKATGMQSALAPMKKKSKTSNSKAKSIKTPQQMVSEVNQ